MDGLYYSKYLEDVSNLCDAEFLLAGADFMIGAGEIQIGLFERRLFEAGSSFQNRETYYFIWHGDGQTHIFFSGTIDQIEQKLYGFMIHRESA